MGEVYLFTFGKNVRSVFVHFVLWHFTNSICVVAMEQRFSVR